MCSKVTVWMLCTLLCGCRTLLDTKPSLLIVIHTTHATPFTHPQATYVRIEQKGSKYLSEGKLIPTDSVNAFFAAVQLADDGPLSFSRLGFTQDWLDQNAEPALDEFSRDKMHSILPAQKELFIRRFRSSAAAGKAVDAYFDSYWTDDFPAAYIEIYDRRNGRAIIVESTDIHDFMLPWRITEKGVSRRSFNTNISRTLGTLLPDDDPLKVRISGTDLRRHLSEYLCKQMMPRGKH